METLPSYTAEAPGAVGSNAEPERYAAMRSVQTLQLLHVNKKHQTFSFPPGTCSFQYSIQVRDNSGLMKKPDLTIARESGTLKKVGEGRFEKYGAGTTIKYLESGMIQDLQLESSLSQRFMVTVDGKLQWWWQPSQGDKLVAEVVTAENDLMALFTYSGEHVLVGRDVKDDTVLGVLEIDAKYASQPSVLDQLAKSDKKSKIKESKPKGPSPMTSKSPSPLPETPASESKVSEKAAHNNEQSPAEESFESYYLKQITAEFADDIDKIRNAPDFSDKSVPVLIQALKQTGATFTEEEKQIIMGAKK